MSGKVYEMLWDCQFCGTKKLLGKTHRFCPNCGASQNPDSRYFPSDEEKVAVEDHQYVGADRICPSCNELNSGNAEFCQQCGAPLTKAAEARRMETQERAEGERFESSGSRNVLKERHDRDLAALVAERQKPSSGLNWKVIGLVVLVLAVIGGIIAALTITRETTVVAMGHSWEREIRIDRYDSFSTQSWWDVPPAGDNVVRGSCTDRQRSTRQVPDGQECRTRRVDMGDGTFREERVCETRYRSEPVYDRWCSWSGYRWNYSRSVSTAGQSVSETPYWGEYALRCDNQRSVGCERIDSRLEAYHVTFKGDEHEYVCDFAQLDWQLIPIESVWKVNVRAVDARAADCNSLQRQN